MKSYVAHCQSGYYAYDKYVVVGHTLRMHPYAQCGYNINKDGVIQFVSYETIVLEIEPDGWCHLYGEFSTTTSKQITWFLREWSLEYNNGWGCASYATIRNYYRKGLDYNLRTDETQPAVNGMIQTIGVKC